MAKKYVFTETRGMSGRTYESRPLTLVEAIEYYKYTLECGASYAHERGNKKINLNPKTVRSLVTNLNNAINNSARNGYGGHYSAELAVDTQQA